MHLAFSTSDTPLRFVPPMLEKLKVLLSLFLPEWHVTPLVFILWYSDVKVNLIWTYVARNEH